MLGKLRDTQTWQPWIQNSLQRRTFNASSTHDPKRNESYEKDESKSFVLFVRISSKENHEAFTLRGLQDGIKIYQVKAKLEMISGLPAHMVELYSLQNVLLDGSNQLKLGINIKCGETLRLRTNSYWNGLLQSSWRGSLSEVKKYLNVARRRRNSPIAFPNGDTSSIKEKEHDALMGSALFVSSRRGNEEICRFLLKSGANTTYVTALGNTCLHTAAHGGYLTLIQLLVSHGANVRFRNVEDESPMAIAVNNGHFECARWLWLNQWTLSITKDALNTTAESKPHNYSFIHSDIDSKKIPSAILKPRPRSVKETIGRTEFRINLKKQRNDQKPTSTKGENDVWIKEKHRPRPFTAGPFLNVKENIQIPKLVKSVHSDYSPRTNTAELATDKHKPRTRAPSNVKVLHSNKAKEIVTFLTSRREVQRSIPSKFQEINLEISDLHGNSFNLQKRLPSPERKSDTVQVKITKASSPRKDEMAETLENPTLSSSTRNSFDTKRGSESLAINLGDDHGNSRDISVAEIFYNSISIESKDADVASQSSRDSDLYPPFTDIHNNDKMQPNVIISLPVENVDPALSSKSLSPHNNEYGGTGAESNEKFILSSTETSFLPSPLSKLESLTVESREWRTGAGREDSTKSNEVIADHTSESSSRKNVHFSESPPHIPTESTKKTVDKEYENKKEQIRKLPHKKEGNVLDVSVSRRRVSPINSPSPMRRRFDSDVFENEEQVNKREEKNKKAFEEWLLKKRKNSTKSKENDENAEKQRKLSSAKFSFSMTYDEWLQMKKEMDEKNKETIPAQTSHGKANIKLHTKYQKTYEEWIREKESENLREVERRRSEELERLKKSELEAENRKREYERKMEAWRKKKEEMEKNAADRAQVIRRMELERARLMYHEWISKPRVKSFKEWMDTKNDDARLNKVSKAQMTMEEEHQAERENIKEQIAKDKFQQWVFKKNLTKLFEERKEFEKSKKKRLNMERKLALAQVKENEASAE